MTLLAAPTWTLSGGPAWADGSMFDAFAKSVGLGPMEPNPPDFVKASRPTAPPADMPVFDAPDEPPSKVKSGAELKAMDADLTGEGRKHDALRAAFPPSAKAVAQASRDKRHKSASKTASGSAF